MATDDHLIAEQLGKAWIAVPNLPREVVDGQADSLIGPPVPALSQSDRR